VCVCVSVWTNAYLRPRWGNSFDVARSLSFITALSIKKQKKSSFGYVLRPEKMMHLLRWWLTVIFTRC